MSTKKQRRELLQKACRLIEREINEYNEKTEKDYNYMLTYYHANGWSFPLAIRKFALNAVVEVMNEVKMPYRYTRVVNNNIVYKSKWSPEDYHEWYSRIEPDMENLRIKKGM